VKRRRKRRPEVADDSSYICESCGEEIVIPIDLTQGNSQEYVEDCPVCCCPNVVNVEIQDDGEIRVWATRE
jgi:hypothetical protein